MLIDQQQVRAAQMFKIEYIFIFFFLFLFFFFLLKRQFMGQQQDAEGAISWGESRNEGP